MKNQIALWDVLKACEREGSSDNAIIQEAPNDFKTFFETHKQIKLVVFNGKNAEAYFKKFMPSKTKCKIHNTSFNKSSQYMENI